MRAIIHPEQQIQRINEIVNQLQVYKDFSSEVLNQRPSPKSWSPLEVIQHMILGQAAYSQKIETALSWEGNERVGDNFKTTAVPSFLIKRFPPQDNEVRFKMKTMKRFQPVFEVEADPVKVFSEFEVSLEQLKGWVENYRTQPISLKKFNSAVGAWVRFNVPEACEFILCHNERHMAQVGKAIG